jgi:hypothetical protein
MTEQRVTFHNEDGTTRQGWIMAYGIYTLFVEGEEKPSMPRLPEAHNYLTGHVIEPPVPPAGLSDIIKH